MKIGILSDGKYGDRAYENIKRRFPVEWILVEPPESSIIDDIKLDLPTCDLYISYLRHPDIVLALLEKRVPTILGVSFGLGFLNQAKKVFGKILAPMTMCSLEDTTDVRVFNEYARLYGRPNFDVELDGDRISRIDILRESPCGSTRGAVADIVGVPLSVEMMQFFALRVCHFCRAPRFGRTCDKEFSGVLHLHELLKSVLRSSPDAQKSIGGYASEIETMYLEKLNAKPM
ncbi:MAG: DUF166 family protein [Candidatus Atabeyarchaeum deiterrae]